MFTLRKTLSGVKARRAVLLLLPAALAGALVSASPLTANAVDVVTVPAATLTEVNVPGTSPMSATAVDLEAAGYTARSSTRKASPTGTPERTPTPSRPQPFSTAAIRIARG